MVSRVHRRHEVDPELRAVVTIAKQGRVDDKLVPGLSAVQARLTLRLEDGLEADGSFALCLELLPEDEKHFCILLKSGGKLHNCGLAIAGVFLLLCGDDYLWFAVLRLEGLGHLLICAGDDVS